MRRTLILSVLLALALAAGAAGYGWHLAHQPYQGYVGELVVDIASGLGSKQIVDRLVNGGVIQYRYPALAYLFVSSYRGKLQAGEYLFDEAMSTDRVFEKMARGQIRLYTFTVPEGLRVDEIADRWEKSGFGEGIGFLEAAHAALPRIQEIDPAAVSVEGYLFPETYFFPKTVTPEEAVDAMIRGFEDTVAKLEEALDPDQWPLDLNGMLILASLIESEAAVADERVLISSVFLNRLDRGMRLECDPTVIYAMIQDGSYRGSLLVEDLDYDSPYNTYVHADLPPGPISNPGYLSMLAAVRPSETDYLFFVRTDGGRHAFSSSLAEHNRAVALYRLRTN